MTGQVGVRVDSPDGARWAYADQLGRVTGLTYEWAYPGGPQSAEFSLDTPVDARATPLVVGATLSVYRGAAVAWRGRVSAVERGTPWRVRADGLGGLAAQEPVSVTGTVNQIIDQAIADGLPWTRPASVSGRQWSGGDSSRGVGETSLSQVLDATLLTDGGKRWTVSTAGVVSAVTDPTTPTYLVQVDVMPPMVLSDYVTRVVARYQTSTGSYASVRVANTAAEARFGRVTQKVDFGYVTLDSATATTYAQAYLARVAPKMTITGGVTVTPGRMTTETSAPVDLALARPGRLARVRLLFMLRDTLVVPTTAIDMLVGSTRYDVDAGELTISPAERSKDPFRAMFDPLGGLTGSIGW